MQDSNQIPESLPEDFPAKTYPWLGNVLALMVNEAAYSGTLFDYWNKRKQNGSYLKTSLVYLPQTTGETLEQHSERWLNAGIVSDGVCLMLNTLAFPKEGAESLSLGVVLETQNILPKYYLSPKACEGILRRANNRGKVLPEMLEKALVNQCLPMEKK